MADDPIASHPSSLATAPPAAGDRRWSVTVVAVTLAGLVFVAPYSGVAMPRLAAFIPSYESALAILDLVTSVLLLSQFTILRRWSLLVLASAYLFDTLLVAAHALSFPGVFAQVGLFGDAQTTAWLYVFWHVGFPILVGAYARIADSPRDALPTGLSNRRAAVLALCTTGIAAAALVLVSSHAADLLPILVVDGDYSRMVTTGISPAIVLACVAAIASMWRRRLRSVLDLWLLTVLWVWICDVLLSAFVSSARFHLGWYGGRLFGLFAASTLLIAFLFELDRLYGRLARAVRDAEARNVELIRSRGELARAQRLEALGQLTSGIAHDFNNLLAAIRGNLEMITRRPADTERVARLAGNAMKSSERGAQLIRRLMSIARKQDLHPEAIDTRTALAEFATLAAGILRPVDHLALQVDEHGTVFVDPADFQSALLNLVTNARDAMDGGGTITIRTRRVVDRDAPCIEISVSDEGGGMTPEVQARIFEPFFTTKSLGLGTGLGLSQVQGFAQAAGGSIAVDSSPGCGATLRLSLPLEKASPSVASDPTAARSASPPRLGILLVDDDRDVLDTTRDQVEELGYAVVTASSGDEAFDLLVRGLPVDIVLSDIMMPGKLNGVQLAAAVRPVRPELKWLLTSGFTGGALAGSGLSRDYVFLPKPYSQRDLAEKLGLVAAAL